MTGQWMDVGSERGTSSRGYLAQPSRGSGPGLLVCHDEKGLDAAMLALADRLAEEGYVVVAPELDGPGDAEARSKERTIAAALRALRARAACRGRLGALGFGSGASVAIGVLVEGLVECAVAYDPELTRDEADRLIASGRPAVLHLAGEGDGPTFPTALGRALADPPAAEQEAGVKLFRYSGTAPGFGVPGRGTNGLAAAGMSYSRTIGLFRREIGPQFDLDALWEEHRACEFVTRDADATMKTMVAEPYVNHVPTMTGGFGQGDLHRFYRDHFIPNNPPDMRNIPISRTVGADRVVNEGILCFTHDRRIDWLLPGIEPTGRYVEVALVGIITFRGGKLVHEHIYWDQASVLVQIGLLDPTGLPVAGIEAAKKVLNPTLPSNRLLQS